VRKAVRFLLLLIVSLPAVMASPLAHAADATVNITDSGFDPPVITIPLNGTVTWTNSGKKVHTATVLRGPMPFDTGGLGPGQSFPVNFTVPGTYTYTSATDCGNAGGSPSQGFDCGTVATVAVVDNNLAYNPNAFNAPPTPVPTPVFDGPPPSVTVQITKDGFVPATATVGLGGSVTFINMDNTRLHSVITTGGGNPGTFDSGGLPPGISTSFGFTMAGTYTYTSATDCLNGNKTPGFNCAVYQIIVSPQASSFGQPQVQVATGTTTVNIKDDSFDPKVLAVKAGQTVTWVNNSKEVQSIVSDPGYYNAFDSGGVDPGKSFSVKFDKAGSYSYHSTMKVNYAVNEFGNVIPQWLLQGTIIVQ
jgi:plastocyanin